MDHIYLKNSFKGVPTMMKEKIIKRPMVSFVIMSYIIFIVLFILTGISMMIEMPKATTKFLQVISAWSSTFAFLIVFKKVYPGLKLKEFVKEKFVQKLSLSIVISIILIQTLIYVATIALLPSANNTFGITITFAGITTIIYTFFEHLRWGPLGEQIGWRGYMLNELQKKYSALTSALVKGILWGFWHAPLWFVHGYTGMNLIKLCVFYMISLLSISIVITFYYKVNNNLFVPIIIHQLFNFYTSSIKGEFLDVVMYTAILYFILAVLMVIINPKGVLYSSKKLNKGMGI